MTSYEAESNVPVEGVAVTAIGVAVIRARETGRADRLYDDPFARAFVDAARAGFAAERWTKLLSLADEFYEGRTVGVRLVDDRIRDAVDAGIRQIVMLGAGLDTRAFRLQLPLEAVVFEVDLPELFAFKEPVLLRAGASSTCRRVAVPADLRGDWTTSLHDNGFRPEMPTLWVDEGALGPLTQDWNRRVVTALTDLSAPASRFGAGRYTVDSDSSRYEELRSLVGDRGHQDNTSEAVADIEGWLNGLGWDTQFHSWNAMVARFDRPVSHPDQNAGDIAAVRR